MTTIEARIPVAEVTVFEDRAHVVRRGLVQFPQGSSRVELEVAPVLVDKTLAVSVLGPVEVVRYKVVRSLRSQSSDSTDRDKRTAQAEVRRLSTQSEGIDQAIVLTLDEIAQDAAAGRADPVHWRECWARLFERGQHARELLGVAKAELERIGVDDVSESRPSAVLSVELRAEAPGPHPVQIDYVVPNAAWRPHHRVELIHSGDPDEDAAITFESNACVWQNTGEEWTDAVLFFSTQRPSSAAGPPELGSDLLKGERASRPPADTGPVITAQHARDVNIALAPNDGGRTLRFGATARTTVPSTGSPVVVLLSSFCTSTRPKRIARPRQGQEPMIQSELVNQGDHPILAGPVDVIMEGGLRCRASVELIKPGAPFELPLGWDESIRVERVDRSEAADPKKARAEQMSHTVELSVSNLGTTSRELVVEDSIPLVGVDCIEVEYDREASTGQALPNDHGLLSWVVEVPEHGHERIVFHYRARPLNRPA